MNTLNLMKGMADMTNNVYQVKLVKEIMDYQEAVFLGLSLKQIIWGTIAIGCAAATYFATKDVMDSSIYSWLCVIAAAPAAFFGFFKYHGMSASRLLVVMVRYVFMPKKLSYKSNNYYYKLLKQEGVLAND